MPRLRSPVSGSRVTTQGKVMKRPPSSGQHLRMGRLAKVGQASSLPDERARTMNRKTYYAARSWLRRVRHIIYRRYAAARIEELVAAHRMLLANASHELRTPLARIRS